VVHACKRRAAGVKVSNHERVFTQSLAGANRRWRCQFRCRGSRRESAVAQLSTLGHKASALQIMFHAISHSPWFLIGLCLVMAVGFSSYLLYCLIKGKLLQSNHALYFGWKWIYRDEDPFCYWFYIAIYSFFDGVAIFMFITLSYQSIKGLPLKL